ncbi:MAG TPA: ATP-binding protein [Chitinophagaceae bacterium]|nr:ATP-binding protein [Chitinophagaceae bacterium]
MKPRKIKIQFRATGFITVLYLFLLSYTIAILVAWGFFLEKQNREYAQAQITILRLRTTLPGADETYQAGLREILRQERLHTLQYFGEGGTFLLIILIGAGYVYGAVRRQIRLSHQQLNFMMAVTHELKSPIAVIRLNMETLSLRTLGEEAKAKLLNHTIMETLRLNQLCNNMLMASQLESRQYQVTRENLDMEALLDHCIRENRPRSNTHEFLAELTPGVMVSGDRFMLHLAFNNLMENAIKYSPPGSSIRVSLTSVGHRAVIQVVDQGSGIPDGEKRKIFNRFYRIGNENTRMTKGTGLGLYLTMAIVKQHRGSISVMDNAPKGSIFEIIFPVI